MGRDSKRVLDILVALFQQGLQDIVPIALTRLIGVVGNQPPAQIIEHERCL